MHRFMRFSLFPALVAAGLSLVSCTSDGRDDRQLDMSLLTGKDWYYTWLDQKDSYGIEGDVLEVLRLERGGDLVRVDFGGRRSYTAGRWTEAGGNRLVLEYSNGKRTDWSVQHSGPDYIETMVDAVGTRKYTLKPTWLGELTADAFLVNEYGPDGRRSSYVAADVRGNRDLREGRLLLKDGNSTPLVLKEYYWKEKDRVYQDGAKAQEVRFALRIGRDRRVKLADSLYAENLPPVPLEGIRLGVEQRNSDLEVGWTPLDGEKIWYRLEVLPENGDEGQPYFLSHYQQPGVGRLTVNRNTSGEVNRLERLKPGRKYLMRLSAVLFEPGIHPLNEEYGPANRQAVSFFTVPFVLK